MRGVAPCLVLSSALAGCLGWVPGPAESPTPPAPGEPAVPAPPGPGPSTSGAAWPFASGDVRGTRAARHETAIHAKTIPLLAPLWSFETNGSVTGTPTVRDGLVHVATWRGWIYALDARTGEVVWSRDNRAQVDASVTLWGGLAFYGDNVALLHAVEAATGKRVWSVKVDDTLRTHLYATPLVLDLPDGSGLLVLGVGSDQVSRRLHGDAPLDFRGQVVAYDPRTGAERWRTYLAAEGQTGAGVWGTPRYDETEGLVLFGTANAYTEPAGNLTDAIVAIEALTGRIRWSHQATKDDVFTHANPTSPDDDFGSSGTLFPGAAGRPLFGIGQKSSVFWALDARTGEVAWRNGQVRSGQGIIGDSAFAEGVVVVPYVTDRRVAALDPATGVERWSRNVSGDLYSDPVLVPGAVLVGDASGALAAFSLSAGEPLWQGSTGGAGKVYGGLSVADGRLFVPIVRDEFLGPRGAVLAFEVNET